MALESSPKHPPETVEDRERVIVRFAGDAGDGMQLAGTRFTDATAMFGNDQLDALLGAGNTWVVV